MRSGIKQLCVTTWGAVLEFRGWHNKNVLSCQKPYRFTSVAHVADPDAIDAGQFISAHEIVLIATVKKLKNEPNSNDNFMLPNGDSMWGKNR